MEPQEVIDLGRNAIKACLIVGGPILLASLVVGMLVGALQAMTQVPDQSVSFVPKLICLILGIGLALPWLTDRMLDYSREAFTTPISLRNPLPQHRRVNFERTASQENLQTSSPVPVPTPMPVPVPAIRPDEKSPSEGQPEVQPSKPPFQLPGFRFSRLPKENLSS